MWMLCILAAQAGEIQVIASRPVVVSIDGRPAGVAGTLVDTTNLPSGDHRVEVRNFVGSILAQAWFTVADSERLRLSYDRQSHTLQVLDKVPLTSEMPPDSCDTTQTGSLVVTGLSDISGSVTVQGNPIPFNSDVQGFLATALEDPAVEVHIQDNDTLRFHGAIAIFTGKNQRCNLRYFHTAWTLDCAISGEEVHQGLTRSTPLR